MEPVNRKKIKGFLQQPKLAVLTISYIVIIHNKYVFKYHPHQLDLGVYEVFGRMPG